MLAHLPHIDFLYDFINSGDPTRREFCNKTIRDGEMAAGRDRITGDYNDFWLSRDLLSLAGKIHAATLMSHAFNDWNVVPGHSVRIYEALKKQRIPLMAYFHQGGHGGGPPLEMRNKWFSRYLYGVDNGVENEPRAWIVREGANDQQPTPYDDYPNPAAQPVKLHLYPGGSTRGGLALPAAKLHQGAETLVDDVHAARGWRGSRAPKSHPNGERVTGLVQAGDVHVVQIGRNFEFFALQR